MVYNEMLYRPATLTERLRAKYGDRARTAVFKAVTSQYSATPVKEQESSGEVLSFFGRLDDTRTAERAIPKARTAPQRRPAHPMNTARPRGVNSAMANARPRMADPRMADSRAKTAQKKANAPARPTPSTEIVKAFSKAYVAGAKIRRVAESGNVPRRVYAPGAVPSGALRRGRSNIPGSRHAILVTANPKAEKGSLWQRMKTAFADRHVAEHRVSRTPFPFGFVTLVGICAFMVMAMILSFSQVHEYNNGINELKNDRAELTEQAAKLEVMLEERDDIRKIEKIAVEEIGMVSSDRVKTKFVSVSADDRVEVVKNDTAEDEEKGFSALLSVIGESLGEYFN